MDKNLTYFIRTFIISFAVILCLPFSVVAAPSIADYGQLPTVQNMAISPSGNRVAYRKVDKSGDMVVVYSLKDNKVVVGIDVSENIPRALYFVSEDKLILNVTDRDRMTGYVNQTDIGAAYIYNIKKKSLKLLLAPGNIVAPGQTYLSDIIGISSDNKKVYMAAWAGEKLSSAAKANYKRSLLEVKMNRPRRPSYHATGSIHTIDYFLDSDGEPLIEERYSNDSNLHTVLVKKGKKWIEIYAEQHGIRVIIPVGVTADFQHLVVKKYNDDTNMLDYYLMSLKDGSLSSAGYTRKDRDAEHVLTDINRVVYGVAYAGFTRQYKLNDSAQNKRLEQILAMFPDHTVELQSWSKDWKDLVIYAEGPNFPGDFYVFSEGKDPRYITTARPTIAPEDIHPIAELTFTARDGLKIPTLLTIPKGKIENIKDLPAVVLPHGGPESYDRIKFDWLSQAIANNGYLVIQPQFRGSAGFGWDFQQAGHGEWGRKMQDDVTDSVKFMANKGFINLDRVCIVGWSYGGYAALAGGAFTPDLYSCVVSINGVSDINKMLSSAEYYAGSDHWVVSYWQKLLAQGNVDDKHLKAISPIRSADKFQAPALLIYGENDDIVRGYQSENMHSKLQSHDKESKLVEIEDDNHGLETSTGRQKALTEIISFLNQHLK